MSKHAAPGTQRRGSNPTFSITDGSSIWIERWKTNPARGFNSISFVRDAVVIGSNPIHRSLLKTRDTISKPHSNSQDQEIMFREQCPDNEICGPHSETIGKNQTCHVCNSVRIREHRVMIQKKIQKANALRRRKEMTNIMILNTNEFETKRSLETGRRLFIIPFSEKQNIYAIEGFRMDT